MQVFVDCDGVLADFDKMAIELCGTAPRLAKDKSEARRLWAIIAQHADFFFHLTKMQDADGLVQGIQELGFEPVILTGVPPWEGVEEQKLRWRRKHFPELEMITCRSIDKRLYGKPGDVLIDDWQKSKSNWEEMGGIFILHVSAEDSLQALRQLVQSTV